MSLVVLKRKTPSVKRGFFSYITGNELRTALLPLNRKVLPQNSDRWKHNP